MSKSIERPEACLSEEEEKSGCHGNIWDDLDRLERREMLPDHEQINTELAMTYERASRRWRDWISRVAPEGHCSDKSRAQRIVELEKCGEEPTLAFRNIILNSKKA